MEKYKIVNYIEVDGEDVPMDSLTEERRRQLAVELADKVMLPAGYKRKPA